MVEDDTVTFKAFVRIIKDETGVLWHKFIKYVLPLDFSTSNRQLRFQEGDWICWPKKSRCDMLHELSVTVALLHKFS